MYADADTFSAMMVSQGSALLDDPEKRVLFAERGGVSAMSLISQLSKSGAAHMLSSRDAAVDEFAQAHAGFLFGWMSELSALRGAQKRAGTDFAIGIANVPQSDPSSPYMLIRGRDLVLLKTDKERERRAWFFVRWLTAPQQSARWARAADAIPLRASALNFLAADLLNNPRFRQIQSAAGGTVPHFVPQSVHPRIGLIEKLVEATWSQIALTKVDIIPTLNGAAAQANQILASNQ
jgi:ABC-type glycerol-3-phosphate transport system substrate-binding protein